MTEWIPTLTFILQLAILGTVSLNYFGALRVKELNKHTLSAIREYRREIAWLEARVEQLEIKVRAK